MDYLQMSTNDIAGLHEEISKLRILFHPDTAPDGYVDFQKFLEMHNGSPIMVILDNNVFIDLVKLCREGSLKNADRMRSMALFMLWSCLYRIKVSAGSALQEKAAHQGERILSNDYSCFENIWDVYTPQQWFDLYGGRICCLPPLPEKVSPSFEPHIFAEKPLAYYHAYASLLRLVTLIRDKNLSKLDKIKHFIEWTYSKTIVGKYVLAYAVLLIIGADAIKAPDKAYSLSVESICKGCQNQAWDLANIGEWSRLLSMRECGDIPEEIYFATQDKLLQKIITHCIRSNNLTPFIYDVMTKNEADQVIAIFGECKSLSRQNRLFDKTSLEQLVKNEEAHLVYTITRANNISNNQNMV